MLCPVMIGEFRGRKNKWLFYSLESKSGIVRDRYLFFPLPFSETTNGQVSLLINGSFISAIIGAVTLCNDHSILPKPSRRKSVLGLRWLHLMSSGQSLVESVWCDSITYPISRFRSLSVLDVSRVDTAEIN